MAELFWWIEELEEREEAQAQWWREYEEKCLWIKDPEEREKRRQKWWREYGQKQQWREAATATGKTCSNCGGEIGDTVYRYKPILQHGRYSIRPNIDALPTCAECSPEWFPEKQTRVYKIHMYTHELPCEICGRAVLFTSGIESPSDAAPSGVFCSDSCRKQRKGRAAASHEKRCAVCGEAFTARRADARTCSPACRQKSYRKRLQVGTPVPGES